MFVGYEDADDTVVYEDELYREESPSEQSVDSEVEFHLYSQIHYSQNLGEISTLEMDEEDHVAGVVDHSSVLTEKHSKDKKTTEFIDGGAQVSGDPEIIVLSDTPDEDSVYKSKVKKSTSSLARRRQTPLVCSTPRHPEAPGCNALCPPGSGTDVPRKRKHTAGKPDPGGSAGAHAIQDVFVIDDSSEEESLISESDNVESWMLLGASTDDRDKDIMLNLEGCATPVSEGDVDVDWSISNKDLEAQISNRGGARHGARYYSADKAVTCRNCGRAGHLSKNCPAPKKVPPCCLCAGRGHLQSNCPARFCLNCCLPGHCYQQCLERACWSKLCNRCHMKGHYADTKPGPIKAAAAHAKRSASVYCYNCSQEGHFGYECSERRMHGSMFPTSPFIYYYDNEYDIKRRANRLKRKVAELQEAGLLPEQPETPRPREEQGGHGRKRKSKPWKGKEHGKRNRSEERHQKPKPPRAEQPQEKHDRGAEAGERVPRAGRGGRARHAALAQALLGSTAAREPLEGAKRKKKWKEQKGADDDAHDNFFLIKQRRKNSKQKSWC
ncbi:zinc finger CCHC domain-containing protein 7 isoform X2 [Patagioenas fasciata]|uniref:zinc finger CCHC domain-containing protein 7 isoform X2 n=1 Tax=Patagioenas fasciata TaxID=372321 RepID=UPI0032E85F59